MADVEYNVEIGVDPDAKKLRTLEEADAERKLWWDENGETYQRLQEARSHLIKKGLGEALPGLPPGSPKDASMGTERNGIACPKCGGEMEEDRCNVSYGSGYPRSLIACTNIMTKTEDGQSWSAACKYRVWAVM